MVAMGVKYSADGAWGSSKTKLLLDVPGCAEPLMPPGLHKVDDGPLLPCRERWCASAVVVLAGREEVHI